MTETLRVSELFSSLQGEGPAAGRSATFLRLAGCNLSCSWCDTPYTWDAQRHSLRAETTLMSAAEILDRVDDARLLVLTGGEPLLQQSQPAFANLLENLPGRCALHIETNGTIQPSEPLLDRATTWVVSPKLDNAGMHRGRQEPRISPFWAVHGRTRGAHLKIVCGDQVDVNHAVYYADALDWPRHRVWLMPEGVDALTLQSRWPILANAAVKWGVNATHRLQILAWGDERGS